MSVDLWEWAPSVTRAEAVDIAPAALLPPPLERPGKRRRAAANVVAPLVFTALAALYFRHAWYAPGQRLIGSAGDPSLFVWYLRWVPWAVSHGHNPLFTTWMNAPGGVNLMWNTSVLLPAMLLAPVTAVWGPVVAYNLLATLALGLSAWTAALALRRVCKLERGAWVGGLIFGFSPFMVAQSGGHPQLTLMLFVPLLAIAVHEAFVREAWSPRRAGITLGCLGALQLLTGEEVLALCAVVFAVGLALLAIAYPDVARRGTRRALLSGAWAGVSFLVLTGVPLAFQFAGPQSVRGPVQPIDHYVADAASWVTPTSMQALHTPASLRLAAMFSARGAEWCAYVGVPLLALIVVVIVTVRRRPVRVAGATLATIMIFAMGPHLHVAGTATGVVLPWDLFGRVPLLDSILPVRFMGVGYLLVAGLVGLAVDNVVQCPRWSRRLLGCAGVVLALAPLAPRWTFAAPAAVTPPPFAAGVAQAITPGAFVVVAPYPEPRNAATLRWQVATGMRYRTFGGYALVPGDRGRSSFVGPTTATQAVLDAIEDGAAIGDLDPQTLVGMQEEMRRNGATGVVVGPMLHQDEVINLFTHLLGTAPRQVDGVAWWVLPTPVT